jgi:hypothetical protein
METNQEWMVRIYLFEEEEMDLRVARMIWA